MKDEIIAEVWRNRDRLAAKYGHNLAAIAAALRSERGLPTLSAPRKASRKRPRVRRSR